MSTTTDLRGAPGGILLPRGDALNLSFTFTNEDATPYEDLSGTLTLFLRVGTGTVSLNLDDTNQATGVLTGTLTGTQSRTLAEGRTYPLLLVADQDTANQKTWAVTYLTITSQGQANSGNTLSSTQSVVVVDGVASVPVTVVSGVMGPQGPAGPAGSGGSGSFDGTQVFTAGATLSGHRVVTLNTSNRAVYCDAATLGHAGRVLGITTGAASNLADATVQMPGWEITESGWSWDTSKPVFVGLNGALTQTIPTLAGGFAFLQVIGWPITSTKLLISPGEPVTL